MLNIDLSEKMALVIGGSRGIGAAITDALIKGLNDAGVNTFDIGLCGTEMVYFASILPGFGGGIMVTASHNPKSRFFPRRKNDRQRKISQHHGF